MQRNLQIVMKMFILIGIKSKVQHRISLGSTVGSLLFLQYVNGLPLNINSINTPVLFTDYTSLSGEQMQTDLQNYQSISLQA